MRVLRILAALVYVRRFRQVFAAVTLGDHLAQRKQRVVRDARGIGTDIGHQTQRAHTLDVHALIKLLGDLHGLAGGEVQLARGLLLQVGGGERRRGVLLALALLHAAHGELDVHQLGQHAGRLRFALELALFAGGSGVAGVEFTASGGKFRFDIPVFLGHKFLDFLLALADHRRGDGLHAPGGQPLANLAPQKRADFVADQTVEHTARLLRVHKVEIHGARTLDRGLHGLAGDLVKLDAAGFGRVDAQKRR